MSNERIKELIEEWIDEREGNIYPNTFDELDLQQLSDYILFLKTQLEFNY